MPLVTTETVLGLDPSLTNYGWAVHLPREQGSKRCLRRGRIQTPANMLFVSRYILIRERLREIVTQVQPTKVALESPVFNDLWSEGMYALFTYTIEALFLEKQDVVLFTPGQIKQHAHETLRGAALRPDRWKMEKPDMVEAAKFDTGGKGSWNHNEADAYLCARLGARFWDFHEGLQSEASLSDVERSIFARTHTYVRGKKAGRTERKGTIFREDDRFFLWKETLTD